MHEIAEWCLAGGKDSDYVNPVTFNKAWNHKTTKMSRMARRNLEGYQRHNKERSMAQGKEGSDSKKLPFDWQQMGFQEERKQSLPHVSLWVGIRPSSQDQPH